MHTLYSDTIGRDEEVQLIIAAKRNEVRDLYDLIDMHEEKRRPGWRSHIYNLQASINLLQREIVEILK